MYFPWLNKSKHYKNTLRCETTLLPLQFRNIGICYR